jgi:hypothetical protein
MGRDIQLLVRIEASGVMERKREMVMTKSFVIVDIIFSSIFMI